MSRIRWEFVSMESTPKDSPYEQIITMRAHVIPSWFERVVRKRKPGSRLVQFIGGVTVWHTYPEFHRVNTSMESRLADIWTRERHFAEVREQELEHVLH
jgi:hypothetical protein